MNVSRLAPDVLAAPYCKECEGSMDLIIVPGRPGLWKLIKIFLCMETGEHIK